MAFTNFAQKHFRRVACTSLVGQWIKNFNVIYNKIFNHLLMIAHTVDSATPKQNSKSISEIQPNFCHD